MFFCYVFTAVFFLCVPRRCKLNMVAIKSNKSNKSIIIIIIIIYMSPEAAAASRLAEAAFAMIVGSFVLAIDFSVLFTAGPATFGSC